jgi:hypothetical protein
VAAEAVWTVSTDLLRATSLAIIAYLYTDAVIISSVHKRILYLVAVIPLFLLHAVPATSPQQI